MFLDPARLHHGNTAVLAFEVTFRNQLGKVEITFVILAQQHHAVGLRLLVVGAHPDIDTDNGLDPRRQRGAGELDHGEQIALIGQRHRRHACLGHRLSSAV